MSIWRHDYEHQFLSVYAYAFVCVFCNCIGISLCVLILYVYLLAYHHQSQTKIGKQAVLKGKTWASYSPFPQYLVSGHVCYFSFSRHFPTFSLHDYQYLIFVHSLFLSLSPFSFNLKPNNSVHLWGIIRTYRSFFVTCSFLFPSGKNYRYFGPRTPSQPPCTREREYQHCTKGRKLYVAPSSLLREG